MKNILVKIPSANQILFYMHRITIQKRIDQFVGATMGVKHRVLLELGRILCARKNAQTSGWRFWTARKLSIPMGRSGQHLWSRELAASLALSGTLRRVKAMILVDMVGPANPVYKRETNSTPWLTEVLWSTAARLGYGNVFINESIT